jgi:DNA topoisomerase-2
MKTEEQYLTETYQQKSDIEHVLIRPDTYIGSVHTERGVMFISELAELGESASSIVNKEMEYNPGLYKLFDEGIVNCRDHSVRMKNSTLANKKNVTQIDISVDEEGVITMFNDGDGLDVAIHPELQIWIPEMIFGHLRSGRNFNTEEEDDIGGKNGYGFKAVLVWSTWGQIETVDHRRQLRYTQQFTDNLTAIHAPLIEKVPKTAKPYMRVMFRPDYARFGISMTNDIRSLFLKRTLDICALTDDNIKVSFNGVSLKVKNFASYIDLYLGPKNVAIRVHEKCNEKWEIGVGLSPTQAFQQVSFVNGICTYKGGKHVEYIMGKITRDLVKYIETKKKIKVTPNSIREQLFLFLNCKISKPSFDSQSKDCLNTTVDKMGSTCDISDSFIEKIAKMGVMEAACSITELKDKIRSAKSTDGKRERNIHIEKYHAANFAGTAKSKLCTLILCEGDSAKAGVMAGLSKTDQDIYGILPLRGKVLNIRDETAINIAKNKEITELKQIMGLKDGVDYKTMEDVHRQLNYSRILILCDADVDGHHIKGLILNIFACMWPSLFQLNGFLSYMNTPILKVTKGNKEEIFYYESEYNIWKEGKNMSGYNVKYYKGLGTSTANEFKQYFLKPQWFGYEFTTESFAVMDVAFNSKKADLRKAMLLNYEPSELHPKIVKLGEDPAFPKAGAYVTYEDFVKVNLLSHSKYNCERTIAHVMDGLKPCQRKILYSAFKRNLVNDIKVCQLASYTAEHTEYKHGESSLQDTVVKMAQDYMGSNNIALLCPNGQFGTRLESGSDAASVRYIFTCLNDIAFLLFPPEDNSILTYLEEEGSMVEPAYYVPILPMILVNGNEGIGTGFSSFVPPFSPLQLVDAIRHRIWNGAFAEQQWHPYFEGFTGTIQAHPAAGTSIAARWLIKGKMTQIDETRIRITELPVGMATSKMSSILRGLYDSRDGKPVAGTKTVIPPNVVKNYTENNTNTKVDIVVEFYPEKLDELIDTPEKDGKTELERLLQLTTTVSISNMHLHNPAGQMQKYKTIEEILEEHYNIRMHTYHIRKEHVVEKMEKELLVLSNRARFIQMSVNKELELNRLTKEQINTLLSQQGFVQIDGDYKYLIKMPMDSVSKEKAAKIMAEFQEKKEACDAYKQIQPYQLWLKELDDFVVNYREYLKQRQEHKTT